jgi:DtxR family transcriptional regulator, Mn-dependent transcriptional regulator
MVSAVTPEGQSHTGTVDRYLETIFYIAAEGEVVRPGQLSAWLSVSAPTVSEALRRLERDGWIVTSPDRSVELTREGERVASSIVRRHRVLERWLVDVLHFDWAAADLEAERIAVAISDDVIDRIDASMGSPDTCPHGNVIPGRTARYGDLEQMSSLAAGAPARVRRISEVAEHEGQALLQLLADHHIGEGSVVVLVHRDRDGTVTVESAGTQFALPAPAAAAVWVERDHEVAGALS